MAVAANCLQNLRVAEDVLDELLGLRAFDLRRPVDVDRMYLLLLEAKRLLAAQPVHGQQVRENLVEVYRLAACASILTEGRGGPPVSCVPRECDLHIDRLVSQDGDLSRWAGEYHYLCTPGTDSLTEVCNLDVLRAYVFTALVADKVLRSRGQEIGSVGNELHSFVGEVELASGLCRAVPGACACTLRQNISREWPE